MPSPLWDELDRELDCWAGTGRACPFWLRDDDAGEPVAALAMLLDLAAEASVELALAAIPDAASERLRDALSDQAHVIVLQHGFAHRNHAAAGSRAVECGGDRPREVVLRELAAGQEVLHHLFGARFRPVLAPPWNRIDADLVPLLPGLGYAGLSTFGARAARRPAPGLVQVNTHVDPLSWRHGPVFAGEDKVLRLLIGQMRRRRVEGGDSEEPLGLLTHHRDHDPATWHFLERFLLVTAGHAAVRWMPIDEIFAPEDAKVQVACAS